MDQVYTFSLPACAKNISTVRLTTSSIAAQIDMDLETIEDIKVCISEACNLAIRSGTDRIDIEYIIDNGLLINITNLATTDKSEDFKYEMAQMIIQALNEEATFTDDTITLKFSK